VAAFFDRLFGTFDDEAGAGLLQSVVRLALLWPLLAGHAKRCYDRGRTAWFILISFIPIVGAIWFLVELGILHRTQGENRFGPDPLLQAVARQRRSREQSSWRSSPCRWPSPPVSAVWTTWPRGRPATRLHVGLASGRSKA
jgi:hypothetical protein